MTLRSRLGRWGEAGLAALLLALAAGALIWGAERLPLLDTLVFGYDWHNYWVMFQGGWPDYRVVDVFNPPWTLLLLLPLGALSFKASWAVLTLATLVVLLWSVPRRVDGRPDALAILALLFAFWTLRELADGNLAALMVAGFLLLLHGWQTRTPWALAAGVVLATAKLQESWLALLAVGVGVLLTWPTRQWLKAAGLALVVVLPALLALGADWLARLLSNGAQLSPSVARLYSNISLAALAAVPGFPAWMRAGLWLAVLGVTVGVVYRRRWEFSRPLLGCLIAAAMLLSPYTNGSSLVTLLAIGVAPLLRTQPWIGWLLTAAAYAPYVTPFPNVASGWPEVLQMLYALAIWAALAWHVGQSQPSTAGAI